MNRTQIYLPSSQQLALKREAQRHNTTVSAVIRRMIAKELAPTPAGESERKSAKSSRPTLLEVVKEISKLNSKKGPRDLATNLDKYLYGGKQ